MIAMKNGGQMNFKLYFLVGILAALTACDNGGGGGKKKVDNDAIVNDTNTDSDPDEKMTFEQIIIKTSCEVKPQEGEKASEGNIEKIQTLTFDKPINIAKIDAIERASINSTFQTFNKDNKVQIVKTDKISHKSCSPLGIAPSYKKFDQLDVFWNEANGEFGANSTLLGLYKPQEPNVKGLTVKAALFVREDTTKWTLVHEYMHHLFEMTKREKQNIYSYKSRAEYESAYLNYVKFNNEYKKTKQVTPEFIGSILTFVKETREFAVGFPIEEITIENYLLELKENSRLQKTTNFDNLSAKSYISSSAKNAIKLIDQIVDLADAAKSTGYLVEELNEEIIKLNAIKTEVISIKDNNVLSENSEKILNFMTVVNPNLQIHSGCGHQIKFEKFQIPRF